MISFTLTPEQEELRKVVRQFARERVAPEAEAYNRERRFPVELVGEMGRMGLFGLPFPTEVGGMGGDFLSMCLVMEELGRVDQSMGITLGAAVGLGAKPLYRHGTEEQRERWLGPLLRGEQLAGFGLTEPGGGSDAQRLQTRALLDGDQWVLNGAKQFITNAGTPLTAFTTVAAVTGERDGEPEISTIIVPNGTPGFHVGSGYAKVGWHGSDTRDLAFSDCRVPGDHLLGERGDGFAIFLGALDEGRIGISALSVGLIQGCIDECVRYATEREAFGSPIGSYQAVAFKIADMEMAAEVGRTAYYRAAVLGDRVAAGEASEEERRELGRLAALTKLHTTQAAVTASREATQIFGGYGFTTEYPVGRFYQDAKILEIGEGTSEVQRLILARLLGLPQPR